jgi:hypothetical protein
MMKTTMKKYIQFAAAACLALLAINSIASQSGATHYITGQQQDFTAYAPTTPGFTFADFYVNYHDANFGASQGLPFGRLIAANVTVNQQAEGIMPTYAYPFDFFGGTLSSAIIVPYVWVDVKADATFDGARHQLSATKEQSVDGIGDIELMPIMAGWTNGDFHFSGMFNVWVPSGDYQQGNLAMTGLGYWTFEPMVGAGWLSTKYGTEVSFLNAVDFNTENTTADYQSGDIYHIEGTVAQHLPLFGGFAGAGCTAFYMKQLTGDSGSGAKLGSFEFESYGVGATVSYVHPIGKSTLVVDGSWLPQTQVENTVKGQFFWLKAAIAF